MCVVPLIPDIHMYGIWLSVDYAYAAKPKPAAIQLRLACLPDCVSVLFVVCRRCCCSCCCCWCCLIYVLLCFVFYFDLFSGAS